MKPNCYECKHRRDLIGDAHSMCVHPETCQCDDQFGALAITLVGGNLEAAQELNIQGHPHGIKHGCGLYGLRILIQYGWKIVMDLKGKHASKKHQNPLSNSL